jgi:hypothetical protein
MVKHKKCIFLSWRFLPGQRDVFRPYENLIVRVCGNALCALSVGFEVRARQGAENKKMKSPALYQKALGRSVGRSEAEHDVTACAVTLPRVCAFEFSLCDKIDMFVCVVRALLLAQVTPRAGGEGQDFWHLPAAFLATEPVS